jgi:hypothetical protein
VRRNDFELFLRMLEEHRGVPPGVREEFFHLVSQARHILLRGGLDAISSLSG